MNRYHFGSFFCKILIFSFIYLYSSCGISLGEVPKPEWLTSASYKLTLAVWDKFDINETYKVKYVVKTGYDLIFVSERLGIAKNEDSVKVVFPDDFFLLGTSKKAWIDFNTKECIWEIYVNDELMEDGIFIFRRSKIK